MKFSLAVVFAALAMSEAEKSRPNNSLLSKAIPVNKDGSIRKTNRKLADNNNQEITAYSTVSFSSCISMKVNSEDLRDEKIYQSVVQGKVVAANNYVLFNVGTANDAAYDNESNLYMVTLAQWIESVAQQGENQNEKYCQACQNSYDYCYPPEEEADVEEEAAVEEEDAAEEDAAAAEEDEDEAAADDAEEGGERKLANNNYYMGYEWQIPIQCDVCEIKGCFYNDEADEEIVYCDKDAYDVSSGCVFKEEDLKDFMKESACAETGNVEYIEDADGNQEAINIMYGFMCNEKQNGIEIAMFLDDECMLYDKSKSFTSSMQGTYQYAALQQISSTIESQYTSDIGCMKMQYAALYAEGQEGNNNNNNNNNQGAEVNKVCQNILKNALDLDTCGGAEVAEEQAAEEQAEQDGYDMSFYEYDIAEDADAETVCLKLQMENGEFGGYHVYESKNQFGGGGTFFNYSTGESREGASAGKIIGIISAILVVIVAGAMIGQSFAKKGDSKKVPLIGNKSGAMA